MRTIAVMNQKGGVGKTTTSVNLSAALARRGKRVCLIDLDPQAHASLHLGVEALGGTPTIYHVFAGRKTIADARQMVAPNLWVVPSDVDLAGAEVELSGAADRETILRDSLARLGVGQSPAGMSVEPAGASERGEASGGSEPGSLGKDATADASGSPSPSPPLDYLIMDCPPSLGVLTVNALAAAREVFIPLQPHFFALQGLSKLFETTALVTRRLNRHLRVTGVVLCLYDTGTRLAADVSDDLQTFLEQSDPEAPWADARIFQTRVRRNIKLAEAPSFSQSIFDYAPNCAGAVDYAALAEEVLAGEEGSQESLAPAA